MTLVVSCGDGDGTRTTTSDAGNRVNASNDGGGDRVDDGGALDGGGIDAGPELFDGGRVDGGPELFDGGGIDAGPELFDGGGVDGGPELVDGGNADGGPAYSCNCGAFSADPGWVVRAGYRAVIVAGATDGLNEPGSGDLRGGHLRGGLLYVVNQGDDTLRSVNTATGDVATVVANTAWGVTPQLLTTITWDQRGVFDGNL